MIGDQATPANLWETFVSKTKAHPRLAAISAVLGSMVLGLPFDLYDRLPPDPMERKRARRRRQARKADTVGLAHGQDLATLQLATREQIEGGLALPIAAETAVARIDRLRNLRMSERDPEATEAGSDAGGSTG